MKVNFNFLHTFLLVAEHRSFRRAGEEIGRTQSAVSMQIRQLEEQFGLPLFHRTPRTVELTPEGQQLILYARRGLAEVEAGVRRMQEALLARQKVARLSIVPTVATAFLAEIAAKFQLAHADTVMHVQEEPGLEMLNSVRSGAVDLGIGPRVESALDIYFEVIMEDEICAFMSTKFVRQGVREVSLADVVQLPIIRLSTATALRGLIDAAVSKMGLHIDPRYEVHQVETQIALVAKGLGVAILPKIGVVNCDRDLKLLPITRPRLTRQLCFLTNRGHSTPAVVEDLKSIAHTVMLAR